MGIKADLKATAKLLEVADGVVTGSLAVASKRTNGGKGIDDEQVHCERLAYAATELAAAKDLLAYASGSGSSDPAVPAMAAAFAGEFGLRLASQVSAHLGEFGLSDGQLGETLGSAQFLATAREAVSDETISAIGRHVIEQRGVNHCPIDDEMAVMTRDSVRQFADSEVAPLAEHIHRNDDLVSDDLINAMAELGFFGMAVPEQYGGGGMGNLAMIVTTEELSRCSLAAAGSLITRPEILTKALLKGGTEGQKEQWLPSIAAGQVMAAIAVTEPDIGSDVASVRCKAEPGEVGGEQGYLISGAKAWCTFAGRANVIALLARTDPDLSKGARGLSLFIVPKDTFDGHSFEMRQDGGGLLEGKADATPGYRGMHSFTLAFENYFVPAANLVGLEKGLNKGFYLQMNGFAAGRLQTGGRATGLAQAALERTAEYAADRKQFGQPIGEFQLTQHKIGRMATHIMASRQLTYCAALAMDEDESIALEPAMAKLFSSDVAVWTTQEGQLVHGGWGYAEEFPISRYVVDATVLPIFEGVKPILELKVIARNLLAGKGMSYDFIAYEKKERVAYLTIQRPEVRNAIHPPAHAEMAAALDDFAADADCWVAIITGEGEKAFSAGNDLKYSAQNAGEPLAMPPSGFGGIASRFDLFKPVIAAVNGLALGGGFEIALSCDIIIAAEHATFGLPEPRVGLAALAGGMQRLPRLVPEKVALGMMLTGKPISAQRGYDLGLVNEVAPAADLMATAQRWAAEVCECSPTSVRASKQVALQSTGMPLEESLRKHYPLVGDLLRSEDMLEGVMAFAEKRKPQWKGK